MKILFGSAHPYMPQIYGGAQSSTHELAAELSAAGHEVAVLAGLTERKWIGMSSRIKLRFGRKRYVCDRHLGYAIYRAWFPDEVAVDVATEFGADVIVLQSGHPVQISRKLAASGFRCFVYLRNVELDDLGGDIRTLTGTGFIANSQFTAQRYRDLFGIKAPVVLPLIRPDLYKTPTTRRTVTFINPHSCKGLDIAAEVAKRCPDIPFTFVRSWTLSLEDEKLLHRRISSLANVRLRPATSDMKTIYNDAGLIIMPSRWEEAFGRVAPEAHLSGIPVIGTRCGGLPESIGPGGMTVAMDAPVDAWVRAVRAIWDNAATYRELSAAALLYSQRAEMNIDLQIKVLMRIFQSDPIAIAAVPEAASMAGDTYRTKLHMRHQARKSISSSAILPTVVK